jgi:HK97 gp10 family phage protein
VAKGIEGLERLRRRFDAMPAKARAAAVKMVNKSADELVAQMKAIAPRDKGNLRDSVRKEEGRLGDVSAVVLADAKDERGRPYAARVELGHMAPDGSQVPAEPFFYPVVRVNRARIKRRLARAISKGLRE